MMMTMSKADVAIRLAKPTARRAKARPVRTVGGPLNIQFDCWREKGPPGNPRALLTGRGSLGGTLLLAEAIEIVGNDVGGQQAVDSEYDNFLDACWEAFSMDGRAETVKIGGREYFVFVAPAC